MLFAVQDLTPTCDYLLTITRYGLVQGIHSCQIAQVNKPLGLYVAMPTASGPTTPSTMSCVGPGVDNDTRISPSNQDCLPLIPPRQPKPKHRYDQNYNHIHVSSIHPLAATPTKRTRAERRDAAGTAENKARATQQHLDRLGKLASLAKTSLYQDH